MSEAFTGENEGETLNEYDDNEDAIISNDIEEAINIKASGSDQKQDRNLMFLLLNPNLNHLPYSASFTKDLGSNSIAIESYKYSTVRIISFISNHYTKRHRKTVKYSLYKISINLTRWTFFRSQARSEMNS